MLDTSQVSSPLSSITNSGALDHTTLSGVNDCSLSCLLSCAFVDAAFGSPLESLAMVSEPVQVSWQIYFGAAAGVFPFIIGSWEFGKRIVSATVSFPY